jgi:hypothetical protein
MNDLNNRRRHRRVPASIRVFTRALNAPYSDAVRDISLGGAQVETATPLPAGTASVFALQLPHHDAPLEVHARVVWSRPGAMGIAFDSAVPMLTSYVERLERAAAQL